MDSTIWVISTFLFLVLALGFFASTIYFWRRAPSPSQSQCNTLYPCVPTQQSCNQLYPCSSNNTCVNFYIEVADTSGNVFTKSGNNVIASGIGTNTIPMQIWSLQESQGKYAIMSINSKQYANMNNSTVVLSSQPSYFTLENHLSGTVIRSGNFMISSGGDNKTLLVVPYSDMIPRQSLWIFLPYS
jgi:hypothetical protein